MKVNEAQPKKPTIITVAVTAEEIVVLVAVMAAAVETVAAETEIVKDVAGNYLPRRGTHICVPTTIKRPKSINSNFPINKNSRFPEAPLIPELQIPFISAFIS